MRDILITIRDDRCMDCIPQPLVEGENYTTQIVVTAPASWDGFLLRCLLTTPKGVLVDAVDALPSVPLTNTMLDGPGVLKVEFIAMKGGTEVFRTLYPAILPVNAARNPLGDIHPEPLPNYLAQMEVARTGALDATITAQEAAALIAGVPEAEAIRETERLKWTNATAQATTLEPDELATASVTEGETGKVFNIGVPRGERGETGEVPIDDTSTDTNKVWSARKVSSMPTHFGNRYARVLGHILSSKKPCAISLLGDSTGNDANEWFYLAMQWLRNNRPSHSLRQRRWSDATQSFSTWTYRSISEIGDAGEAYFLLPGASGSYVSTPYKSSLDISGDIDIAVKVNALPNVSKTFVSRLGTGAGSRGWSFQMTSTNYPSFYWSADGSALIGPIPATVPYVFQSGVPIWLRVTLDADNGAGGYTLRFYTSQDAYTWNQLGADVVGPAPTSIFINSVALELGARTSGTSGFFPGKIYEAWIRRGIDGVPVASPCAGQAFPAGATFSDVENNIWTVNGLATSGNGSPEILALNGSVAGQVIAYSTDAGRFEAQTPRETVLSFISYGHNEGTDVDYAPSYKTLCDLIATKYPNNGIVCVTQNPKKVPAANIEQHTTRNAQIATLAIFNDYGLVDAFRAFSDLPNGDDYINADGIHPTTSGDYNGSQLWSTVAGEFLRPAIL